MYCRNCGQELTAAVEICPKCSQNPRTGLTYCQVCGFKVKPDLPLCPKCGSKITSSALSQAQTKRKPANLNARLISARENRRLPRQEKPANPDGQPNQGPAGKTVGDERVSPLSRTYVSVLAICPGWLGIAGIHRFYLGKYFSGIIMFLTLGGLGIWSLVDFINALRGKMKDKDGKAVLIW